MDDVLEIRRSNEGRAEIRVLNFDTLIGVKQRAGRPKDLAAIPVLEATRDELGRR